MTVKKLQIMVVLIINFALTSGQGTTNELESSLGNDNTSGITTSLQQGTQEPPFVTTSSGTKGVILLVARRDELEWIDLGQNEHVSNRIPLSNVFSADYDYMDGFVFWTDYTSIYKVKLDGSEQSVFLNQAVSAIAIDQEERRIYYVNQASGELKVANLDGTGHTTLRSVGTSVQFLHIHKVRRELYWIDARGKQILRCTTNGTGLEILVEIRAYSLSLDTASDTLFWTTDTVIKQSLLDGTNNKTLLTLDRRSQVAAYGSYLYWSESTIDVARLNPVTLHNTVIMPGFTYITGMTIDGQGNLLVATGFAVKMFDMTGSFRQIGRIGQIEASLVEYNPGDGLLYWYDKNNISLSRASISGTGQEILATGVRLNGLAVSQSAGKVFWSTHSGVHKSDLDGSNKETIRTGYTSTYPTKLSLDEQQSKLYVFVDGRSDTAVYRMGFDGTNFENFFSVSFLRALLVDGPRGHVYWSANTQKIERRNIDNTDHTVIKENVALFYMIIHGGWLLMSTTSQSPLTAGLYQMDLNNTSDVKTFDTVKPAATGMRMSLLKNVVSGMTEPNVATSASQDTREPPSLTTSGATGTREGPHVTTSGATGTREGPHVTTSGATGTREPPRVTTSGATGTREGPRVTTSGATGTREVPRVTTSGATGTREVPRVTTPAGQGNSEAPEIFTIPSQDTTESTPSSGSINMDFMIVGILGASAFILTVCTIWVLVFLTSDENINEQTLTI